VKSALRGEDNDWSWMSPRATLAAFAAGCAALVGWLMLLGLRHPGGLAVFLASQALNWIGISRVAAESALEVQYPVESMDLTMILAGTRALLPVGLVALAVSMSWAYGSATFNQLSNAVQGEKIRAASPFPR